MSVIITTNEGEIDFGYASNDKYTAHHNGKGNHEYIYENGDRVRVSHYWLIGSHKQVNLAVPKMFRQIALSAKHLNTVIEETGVSILIFTEQTYLLATKEGWTSNNSGSNNTWTFGDVYTGDEDWENMHFSECGMLSLRLTDPFSPYKE